MSWCKVQRGVVDFGASSNTATASFEAVNLTHAFIRLTNTCNTAAGPTAGTTADRFNDDFGCTVVMTNSTTATFTRDAGTAEDWRAQWEIWEYTGPPGGPNEFVVLSERTTTFPDGASLINNIDISGDGYENVTHCIAIRTGVRNDEADVRNFSQYGILMRVRNGLEQVDIDRSALDGDTSVSWVLVEFTGRDWQLDNDTAGAVTTADTDTEIDLTNAISLPQHNRFMFHTTFIEAGDNSLNESSSSVWPHDVDWHKFYIRVASVSTPSNFLMNTQVIANPNIYVQHVNTYTDGMLDLEAGSASPQEIDVPIEKVNVNNSGVIAYATPSGGARTYPRQLWNYYLDNSGTLLKFWRGRHGLSSGYSAQIITFGTRRNIGSITGV